jgi:hypothetical protein
VGQCGRSQRSTQNETESTSPPAMPTRAPPLARPTRSWRWRWIPVACCGCSRRWLAMRGTSAVSKPARGA